MLKKLSEILFRPIVNKRHLSLADFWNDRARRYGKYSVLNMAHTEKDFDVVTDYQKQVLFPLLQSQLSGTEVVLLDFGCGPGRFTYDLARLINGIAIGVDITPKFLELAPKSSLVSYLTIQEGSLPFQDASFDIVWSCLVLGGIPDACVENSIAEIRRILRPGGLFFFVENVARETNTPYWFFRDRETYINMADFCKPKVLGWYEDIGQQIAIFSGRKN